ncbi:MAG TPA: hypothetical protein VH684_13990 [Xanthobacteraceae bacterium]
MSVEGFAATELIWPQFIVPHNQFGETFMGSKSLMMMAATLMAFPLFVSAQTNPPVDQQNPSAVDPKACAPGERLTQDPQTQKPTTSGRGENLSDKLSRNEGVLCPPNLDPEIKAPTPNVGDTPVIPPPGSPGGNPNVRPK